MDVTRDSGDISVGAGQRSDPESSQAGRSADGWRPGGSDTTLLAVAETLSRRGRLISRLAVLFGLLGVLAAVVRGATYTLSVLFEPETAQGSLSRYAGIAVQLGVNLPTSGGETLEYYVDLLHSRAILDSVAFSTYRVREDGRVWTGDLADLYGVTSQDPNKRRLRTLKLADGLLTIDPHDDAGTIAVQISTRLPDLTSAVARRLLAELNRFNLNTRQSKARAERLFTQGRLAVAKAELDTAEERMARFLETNRTYTGSPKLQFEANTLQRRIDLRQQVYVTLAQAYEQARIEEVRSTPVITLIDGADGPVKRQRGIVLYGTLGLLLGCLVGGGLALSAEHVARLRVHDPARFLWWDRLHDRAVGRLQGFRARAGGNREGPSATGRS